MHDLDRVNAAREGFGIFGCMTTLLSAPDVNEVAELFDTIGNAPLEEAVRFEVRIVTLHIHVRAQKHCVALARRLFGAGWSIGADHSHPAIGQEQRTKAIPIAGLTRRPRDYIVERSEEVLDGVCIARVLYGRPTRMPRE